MRSTTRRRFAGVAAILAAGALVVGCDETDLGAALSGDTTSVTSQEAPTGDADGADPNTGDVVLTAETTADGEIPQTTPGAPAWQLTTAEHAETLAKLDQIPVKGRAPKTNYDRDQFGPAWTDDVDVEFGRNGCRTRDDILQRDLSNIVLDDDDCRVLSGEFIDPYSGEYMEFEYGQGTSNLVHIEHTVALSDAWQKGAQQLSEQERWNFANDPRHLIAVSGSENMSKSDSDAASWLPPNKAYRCRMVAIQIDVKDAYNLWVTAPEKDAMERVLGTCDLADDTGQPEPAPDAGSLGSLN